MKLTPITYKFIDGQHLYFVGEKQLLLIHKIHIGTTQKTASTYNVYAEQATESFGPSLQSSNQFLLTITRHLFGKDIDDTYTLSKLLEHGIKIWLNEDKEGNEYILFESKPTVIRTGTMR